MEGRKMTELNEAVIEVLEQDCCEDNDRPAESAEEEVLLPPEKQLELLNGMREDILSVGRTVKRKPVYSFGKRVFDIFASIAAILVLSPFLLIVARKIKKESKGPAIFRQPRVGKDGKVFTMYKFRSMYMDAEDRLESVLKLNKGKNTLMFKADDDPRITPFGRKIRENSVDELPQLFNILKGEMSFVGPRPPLIREVIQYEKEHTIRLAVKGGLTCYWQISGRNDADFDFCIQQDLKYINKRSWWTDLKLIFMTAGQVLSGKGGE